MTDLTDLPQPAAPGAEPDANAAGEDWKSFGGFLIKLVIVVVLFRSLVFTSFNIPSESMMPRLLVGDYLFAAKWPYGYSRFSLPFSPDIGDGRLLAGQPERGDVVIFKHPIDYSDYIKRVIGLPGDTIQMIGGVLHINGVAVERTQIEDLVVPIASTDRCARARFVVETEDGGYACRYPQYREVLPNGVAFNTLDFDDAQSIIAGAPREGMDDTAPVVVPEGHLFLMGDNRDNSLDSRYPAQAGMGIGLVPQANLVGRASFMFFSIGDGIRWSRIGRGI